MSLEKLMKEIRQFYEIEKELYEKYDVKRGLRNKNGSGVMVGLTRIGNVHGYIKSEEDLVPVPGKLFYRGIDVETIVENIEREDRFGFEECAFLLLFGKQPTSEELSEFNKMLDKNHLLPDGFVENMILKSPSNNIMIKLSRSLLASYSYDPNPEDISVENVLRQSIEMIARFPVLIAYGYQARSHYYNDSSLIIHRPKDGLSTAENFLRLIRPDRKYTALEAKTLDISLILHAEHGGGNNSAFTTHVVSSSDTDTYSAISAAVGSLKGPKHGGANIMVMGMMEDIKKNVSNWDSEKEIADYLVKILNKEAYDGTGLIYGIGHAVYTISDPRTIILRKYAEELAKTAGREKEYHLYATVEKLSPELFKKIKGSSKNVCANVDLYSGFVYNMLGIPTELYTPIFAMSRIAGWSAHRIEEIVSGGRIIRPAYKSVEDNADYIPIDQRT